MSMRPGPRILAILTVLPLATACHICRTREVNARFSGQVDGSNAVLVGGASESNVGFRYERLSQVASDSSSSAGAQTLIWMLEQSDPPALVDFLAVELPLPAEGGEVVPVVLATRMGGWGTTDAGPRPPPPGTPAGVYVAKAGFVATSTTGSFTVLDPSPLRLRMDVTFTAADGGTLSLGGEVQFSVVDEGDVCSFT